MVSAPLSMDELSAHLDRGWDLIAKGDFAGAMVSAQLIWENEPDSPEAYNLAGYVFAAEGNREDALAHYQKAIELDDAFVEALLNAAEVLLASPGNEREALRYIEDAAEHAQTKEERTDALLLRADALIRTNAKTRALSTLLELDEIAEHAPLVHFMIGRGLYELGELDKASAQIDRALELDPNIAEAHYYTALVHERSGRKADATVAFLRARDLDAKHGPAPWSMKGEQLERRVKSAIKRLPSDLGKALEGALVVLTELPGAEVVVDGVDPRAGVMIEDIVTEPAFRVGRLFIYQYNLERTTSHPLEIEEELLRVLQVELRYAQEHLTKRQRRGPKTAASAAPD